MQRLIAAVFTALALLSAPSARAALVDAGHVKAELVAQGQVAPGATVYVALRQKLDKGWHTYWRNPGDAGGATTIKWALPAGWTAGDIVWPTPKRLRTGPLTTFVYEDAVLLPVPVTAPADARPGQTVRLAADAGFLVCQEVCIPAEAKLSLDLMVAAGAPQADPQWGDAIARTLAAAPKPAGLDAAMTLVGGAVKISVAGAPLKGGNFPDAYFLPFDPVALDLSKPQTIERGPEGLTLAAGPGYAFQQGKSPPGLQGVVDLGDGRAYEIDAKAGPALAGAAGLGAPVKAAPQGGAGLNLATAALFAFLGGLILNLMPCVFPVLSMKAASLARHAHAPARARLEGAAFFVGVVATFLALAGLLIALKAAGAAVGWGFQLQSPPVVAALALIMLLVGLNLSGLFEIGTSVQGVGGRAASAGGVAGAFLTGVLAVVVAAPCTAPFMAGALGYAFTQSAPVALAVFLALAVGFALPFAALAFLPGLLKVFPRPGAWMEGLKKLLAFGVYATAAWLVWVFSVQTGPGLLAWLLAAVVLTGLGGWLLDVAQRRSGQGAGALVALTGGVLALAAAVGVGVAQPALSPNPSPAGAVAGPVSDQAAPATGEAASEPWSAARLAELRAQGRPVFVNFTAAWCVTCQVNDRAALSSPAVAEAFKRTGAVYLKGDWTNRDGAIAAELAAHGRAGVPLYLIYDAKGGEPVVLPQLLTEGMVAKALEEAARPAA